MTTGIGIAGNVYCSKESFLVRKSTVMCVAGYPALNSRVITLLSLERTLNKRITSCRPHIGAVKSSSRRHHMSLKLKRFLRSGWHSQIHDAYFSQVGKSISTTIGLLNFFPPGPCGQLEAMMAALTIQVSWYPRLSFKASS